MRVNQGDRVEKGQVLAVVDKQPYQLDVESAEADLQKARAHLAHARQEYERQETLHKKGWVAKNRLDFVQTELDSGERHE
jgi:multidrug efflux system membrane fusion protein